MAAPHLAASSVFGIASWRCRNSAEKFKVNYLVSHARGTTAIVMELGLSRLDGELRERISSRGTLSTWVTREMHAEGANLVGQGIAEV
jgi:hypothetical protein